MNYITIIEREEKAFQRKQKEYIMKNIPIECRKCEFLEITGTNKVHCPYMVNKCILK